MAGSGAQGVASCGFGVHGCDTLVDALWMHKCLASLHDRAGAIQVFGCVLVCPCEASCGAVVRTALRLEGATALLYLQFVFSGACIEQEMYLIRAQFARWWWWCNSRGRGLIVCRIAVPQVGIAGQRPQYSLTLALYAVQ